MSATTDAQAAHRVRAEQTALDSLAERLGKQFPEPTAETIVVTIRGEYEDFADSSIRAFIPILVERRVRADLGPVPGHRA